LSEGVFYGRLRSNSFFYDNPKDSQDYAISGFGGSLIYRSAYFQGFGATAGFYTTQNLFRAGADEIANYRGAKDTFSRYSAVKYGDYGIETLAQAFIEYRYEKSRVRVGRQLFESFLAKSNDTKMVPNSFEGATFTTSNIPSTKLKFALLTKQKLRDHTRFHHVLAYGANSDDPYSKWSENDDGAMHRGLTLQRLKGIDDKLLIFELENRPIKASLLKLNYTAVPDLISSLMVEGNYKIKFDNSFSIIPSLRFMYQFDNGAGEIGGANLKENVVGYSHPNSLDGGLFAVKTDFIWNFWSLRFGYSSVRDEGDIVAPWRGFPTGGYSRAMGQTNWYANTDTYLLRVDLNLGKAQIVPKTRLMMRYAIEDFDDSKAGVQSDARVFTLDIVNKGIFPSLYTKLRLAHIDGDGHTRAEDGTLKPDPSYNELRLEFNYFF
jgi:hypothetical protein